MIETIERVFSPDNLSFLLNGLKQTLLISVSVIIGSVIFGTILGLFRQYRLVVLTQLASIYIEIFRNTPLLLWMLGCAFLIPGSTVTVKGAFALFLYTSAIIAEIVRGGLNAIDKGQFEAAYSQGFSFIQTLLYIVLPQCFKSIVPSLLSQVITTVKDTSFLAGLGIMELTRSGQVILGRATQTTEVFLLYGFIGLTYFVVCFSLSLAVRYWHKKNTIIQ